MRRITFALAAIAAALFSSSLACGGGSGSPGPGPGPGPTPQAATPVFGPVSGTYATAQSVTITDATAGAAIYYTADGSTPTTASTKYTSAINVSSTAALKAIATAGGYTPSNAAGAIYLVASAPVTPSYTWNSAQIVAGGFITGIVTHPAQQNLMYARTDIGGAYRWNAVTSSWVPLTDWITPSNWNLTGTEAIGIDPSDATRLYLAEGTYADAWNNNNGAILVSTDQGNTFQTVPMPFKMGSNDNGREAGDRIGVDPNDGSIVYFGSRLNGLWKSADFGATWSQVSSFPVTGPTTGSANDGVGVIFIDFVKSSGTIGNPTPRIYVGVSDTGTEASPVYSLYTSSDAGTTWSAVPGQPTGLYPNHGVFGPDGNLYISYGSDVGPNGMSGGAVWRFNPTGNIWTNITPALGNQGGYGAVAVDAQNPGTVMVSTLDNWGPHDDLYRTTNGGTAWTALRANATDDNSISPWIGILQPGPLGWWMGSLAIDPFNSNHVLYGTGATIWASIQRHTVVNALGRRWTRHRRDCSHAVDQSAFRRAPGEWGRRHLRLRAHYADPVSARRHDGQPAIQLHVWTGLRAKQSGDHGPRRLQQQRHPDGRIHHQRWRQLDSIFQSLGGNQYRSGIYRRLRQWHDVRLGPE